MQCTVTHMWGSPRACGLVLHALALWQGPWSHLKQLWGGLVESAPRQGPAYHGSHTVCTCWGTMPLCGGRQSGVVGLTAWVVLCSEDGCPMPLRYGRGCGVIGVTSWVPLWTSVLCVCWTHTGLLHESHQIIQHLQTFSIPPCVVHNPHCCMQTSRVIVWYL